MVINPLGCWLIGAATLLALLSFLADHYCNRQEIEVTVVAVQPAWRIGFSRGNEGWGQLVYIAEGNPLRATSRTASRLGPGKYRLEVGGWDLPSLSKNRKVVRIIKRIS